MSLPHVCLPIDLDAFVLNEKVVSGTKPTADNQEDEGISLVAPITQPNYVNLRLSNDQIQHDILPRIDVHKSRDASTNPRLSTLYQQPFRNVTALNPAPDPSSTVGIASARQGVYLHWSIPRGYRSAVSEAAPPPKLEGDTAAVPQDKNPSPRFPLVPNRWLVVRLLLPGWSPATANPARVAAWVIESDRLRTIDQLTTDDNGLPIDLETDVAPFVAWAQDATTNPNILNSQAEKYIGFRTPLAKWAEQQLTPEQKVDLTIMNSSNPLFADYTACNANVFSTKDNFFYGFDGGGKPLFLESATCDYVVLGWHSDSGADPLGKTGTDDLGSRLTTLFCASPQATTGQSDKDNQKYISDRGPTRIICHGAKYNVVYSAALPLKIPATDCARNFTKGVDMEPVSVGTSALDAILAFFQAHSGDILNEELFGHEGAQTAQAIMGIRELLYATEDDYDSRIKAADLVYGHNFARSQAGSVWRYDKKKDAAGPPIQPSAIAPDPGTNTDPLAKKSELELIQEINEYQRMADVASSKLDQLRWALFSEWFKYLSDPSSKSAGRESLYETRVPLLSNEASKLKSLVEDFEKNKILPITKYVQVKKVAQDSFFKRADPTLCLAGIDAGWDPLYLNDTPTRFSDRLHAAGRAKDRPDIAGCTSLLAMHSRFSANTTNPADTLQLSNTLTSLLQEASKGFRAALQQSGHREWTGQPFKPQFVEWEGVYHHIDWSLSNWDLQLSNSAWATSNHSQVMYVNPVDLASLDSARKDKMSISGRMLILPQPSFALGAVVAQVLDSTQKDRLPDPLKDPAARTALKLAAQSLKFISGELDGLTDALLTVAKGQHVKPNVRRQGGKTQPMQAAIDASSRVSLTKDDFDIIAGESGRTPYGTLVNFDAPDVTSKPFKPVQHGQFAITQLSIVDKFGQIIACPFPKRKLRPIDGSTSISTPVDELSFIHPCLSEQLTPSLRNGSLNTIYTTKDTHDAATASGTPMTPFIQLSPTINQEARINGSFLERVFGQGTSSWWQPCSDWENPIFGWIIINYADSALQFFTQDGSFYTSLEFGGPTGTIESLKWQPFDKPPVAQASPQLDQLIAKMADSNNNAGANYLKALWEIVRSAIPSLPFPPSEYSGYANAIVGKPLALVNAGCSIELAQAPYWRQHTLPPPPNPAPGDKVDPLRVEAEQDMSKYHFKVKIGDAERPFDGLVAYWDTDNTNTEIKDNPSSSTTTNFDKIWSYTSSEATKDLGQLIEPGTLPQLTPYFLHPDAAADPAAFSRQHVAKLLVKTLLIDPYTPIHLYSGILPIKTLQLASWTIQQALKNMTAFFTVGPLLIPHDVPKTYDPLHPLKPDTWTLAPAPPTTADAVDPIRLPIASGKGTWNWLQPYVVPALDHDGKPTGETETKYNSLSVGNEDGRLRLDPAPYTLVEGFLQLARPLLQPVLPAGGGT